MFKFIHAADIHLDSPLLNLDQYDGAPVDALRVATRDAFDNLIQTAIDEQVQFLLIAGDLYDKDSPDFQTPMHVRKKMQELQDAGVEVFIIQGNHDATAVAKRAFEALTLPANVHVFSTKGPETRMLEDLQVAIHGQGFATKSIVDDLSGNYPAAVPGHFNIGLLHTNLGGNTSHDNYAPSTADGLRQKEYQYWALGHIHKRDRGIGGKRQIIHYSGNTQGRHIRESGPRGCTLVTVDDSHNISMKFRPTDVWRWHVCEIDASGSATADDILLSARQDIEKALLSADDRALAVRVRVAGATTAHRSLMNQATHWRDELRRMTLDAFEERVWLEKVKFRTTFPISPASLEIDSSFGDLIAGIRDLVPGEEVVADVRHQLDAMLAKLPTDVRLQSEAFDLDDESMLSTLINDAKDLLVSKLLDEPGRGGPA